MSRVLITGGAGFIGAHTARALLQRGETVTIVDDFNARYDPRLKEARVNHLLADVRPPQIRRLDIRATRDVNELFAQQRFDSVIHLAAWAAVQASIDNPHIYNEVNVGGTLNVLEAARQTGVGAIVFASSSSVYGQAQKMPLTETDDVTRPLSPYAATKVAGEILCATWYNLYHIPTTCLRFFTVYGPWGRPEMALFRFAEAIVRGEEILMRGHATRRDFTYIDDIVAGIVAAHDAAQGFEIFNLGHGEDIGLPRFIAAIETALQTSARIREVDLPAGDTPRSLANIEHARQKLNFNPTTVVEDGIAQFCRWYTEWYLPAFGAHNKAEAVR